ncbi:MAG: response regulator transcription factor [Anaerolineales bacterium]|nr:response regulator transcription factor [Anaerolineales bacterium]
MKSENVRPRILIIDDNLDYLNMIKLLLRKSGFDVAGAGDHRAALEKCAELSPDVILLDLMMPDVDGWEVYQLLRGITSAPVIMVTASANRENAVRGLEMGLDEYIFKPFYNPEIISRIKKVLRQTQSSSTARVKVFPEIDLRIDHQSHEVTIRGREVRLHQREFELLSILAKHAPRNVPYEVITGHIWGEDNPKNRGHLKTVVFSLRQKLEDDPAAPSLVVNYRSVGYQLATRTR